MDVSLSLDYMRDAAKRAQQEPGALSSFLTLHLNLWVSSKEKWLSLDQWDQCKEEEEPELEGRECYGGLDLAAIYDLASFVLVFPIGNRYHVRSWFWIPSDRLTERVRKDKVPYDQWLREGWIRETEGNVIDFDKIIADIEEIATRYKIRSVAFDRFGASQVSNRLTDAGLEMFSMGQGFVSMAMPTSELARIIANKTLQHDGSPVLRWNADNVQISRDAAGNMKIDKAKARQKVDGMVALVMGLDRALRNKPKESVYSSRGLRSVG